MIAKIGEAAFCAGISMIGLPPICAIAAVDPEVRDAVDRFEACGYAGWAMIGYFATIVVLMISGAILMEKGNK